MPNKRRIRRLKQRERMSLSAEVDGRPFDQNDLIEVEGTRETAGTVEPIDPVKIANGETNDNEHVVDTNSNVIAIDPVLARGPDVAYHSDSDGIASSCIKGAKEVSEEATEESDTETEDTEQPAILRNIRALPADEPTYKLEDFDKNAFIIFNQINVDGYKPRIGTVDDGKRMAKTLQHFGFQGIEYMDLTRAEIFNTLAKFSSMDFTDYGCVAIVVMTHGGEKGLLMAKDLPYTELDILNFFKHREKPTLVTKPVVLIIQACRGYEDMQAAEAGLKRSRMYQLAEQDAIKSEEADHYYLPVEADTLVLHSSYISKPSHRESDGTWFIKALCKHIERLAATEDLESIMIEVKREVATSKAHYVKNKMTGRYQFNKQMPVVTSALMRKLYLRRFQESPPRGISSTSSSKSHDCVDRLAPARSPNSRAQVLRHYEYMRGILQNYANERVDKTAEHLLRASVFTETTDLDHLQTTLIAMSNFLKDKYMHTDKKNYILFYEIL